MRPIITTTLGCKIAVDPIKAKSHRVKAKKKANIFLDVCRLFFDLFWLFFDVFRFRLYFRLVWIFPYIYVHTDGCESFLYAYPFAQFQIQFQFCRLI